MIYATRIKMKPSFRSTSSNHSLEEQLTEIENIYLTCSTWNGWFKKDSVHDYVKSGTDVCVNISPY